MDKKVKQRTMTIVALIIIILAVAAVGFHIYNMPESRLARALDLGQKYLLEEDYEQAIIEFNKALEIDSKNADAYLGKADAYLGLEDSEMAAETLETGYQATEENEEIRERLLTVYTVMVEDAIERDYYEEGKKIYEHMGKLGGEDEELQKRLEELQDDGNEEEDIAQVDEQEEEKEELPYYELGFSPEEFTLAGYSVMDGDHLDDIVQIVAEEIPHLDDVWGDENYEGWFREEYSNEKSLLIEYLYDDSIIPDAEPAIEYVVGTGEKIKLVLGDAYFFHEYNDWPTDMLSKRPFYEGSVTADVSSYEDVVDALGVREVIQQLNWGGSAFYFKSQYGDTKCWHNGYGSKSYSFSTEEWTLTLRFGDDDILHAIEVESL